MTALFFASAAQTPGALYAYYNSDGVGKFIVILLAVLSVITWTIMLDKWWSLYRAKMLSERFLELFHEYGEANLLANSLVREIEHNDGPIGKIYEAGMEKLLEFYAESGNTYRGMPAPCELSEAQYNAIEAVLEREVSNQLKELETHIGILATLVSLSPFLGLFGTVWGVMMAFCGIAVAGKSDFTALAPGVAGALLTTVAGLVVAIPSLIGYNALGGMLRNMTVTMDNFVEQFMVNIKLSQLKLSGKNRREKNSGEGDLGI